MAAERVITLSRGGGENWGFRLHGGIDFNQPLTILKVSSPSIAEKNGLTPGDTIVKINNSLITGLRHAEILNMIAGSGNNLTLSVVKGKGRASVGSDNMVNKQYNSPIGLYSEQNIAETLTAQAEVLKTGAIGNDFKKNEKTYNYENSEVYKMLMSIEKDPEGGGSESAFGGGGGSSFFQQQQQGQGQQTQQQVQLKQNKENVFAKKIPQQTHFPTHHYTGGNVGGHAAITAALPYSSPTIVKSPLASSNQQFQQQQQMQQHFESSSQQQQQASAAASAPPIQTVGGQNICSECERLIVGVFVRIKDNKNLHVECFKCSTCGQPLKNIGYYNINNKLYCDVHAKTIVKSNVPAPTDFPQQQPLPPMPMPSMQMPMQKSTVPISTFSPKHEPKDIGPIGTTPMVGKSPSIGASQTVTPPMGSFGQSTSGFDSSFGGGGFGMDASSSFAPAGFDSSPSFNNLYNLTAQTKNVVPIPYHSPSKFNQAPGQHQGAASGISGMYHVTPPRGTPASEHGGSGGGMSNFQQQKSMTEYNKMTSSSSFSSSMMTSSSSSIQQQQQQQQLQQQQQQQQLQQQQQQALGGIQKVAWPPNYNSQSSQQIQASPPQPQPEPQSLVQQQPLIIQQPHQSPLQQQQVKVPYVSPQQQMQMQQQFENQQQIQRSQQATINLIARNNLQNFIPNSPGFNQMQQQQAAGPPMQSQQPMAPKPAGGGGIGGGSNPKQQQGKGLKLPNRGRGILNAQQQSRVAICTGCQKQIRGPFISAGNLNRFFCPDHFKCANDQCRKDLMEIGFVEEGNNLYCEFCWEQHLAPACFKCGKRVKNECINACDRKYHQACFTCAHCHLQIGSNNSFFIEDGVPYCEGDWNELFTTKCTACGFTIEAGDRWVEAIGKNFHSQCFNCSACKKNLEGQSFFVKAGRPFCKNHAR